MRVWRRDLRRGFSDEFEFIDPTDSLIRPGGSHHEVVQADVLAIRDAAVLAKHMNGALKDSPSNRGIRQVSCLRLVVLHGIETARPLLAQCQHHLCPAANNQGQMGAQDRHSKPSRGPKNRLHAIFDAMDHHVRMTLVRLALPVLLPHWREPD